ncbi:hypothetical protein ACLB2K_015230 [Fragaria x ananassa]
MVTPVKVYGPPISTALSRVLACLLEKEVPYQLIPVNMAKGEHKKPEFLKIQPFGQVPAFEDDGFALFESRSICRYICDKYAKQGNKGQPIGKGLRRSVARSRRTKLQPSKLGSGVPACIRTENEAEAGSRGD